MAAERRDSSKIEKLKRRPQSTYACDVRRILLCKQWFYDDISYDDHRILGHDVCTGIYDSVVFITFLIVYHLRVYTCIYLRLYKYM